MKKKIFMACAALVVSAAAVLGVKAYNYYSMPELMRVNLEALSYPEQITTCTGPKVNDSGKVFCKCENDIPCADKHGCKLK